MATEGTQYDPRPFDSKVNAILGEEGEETYYTTYDEVCDSFDTMELRPWEGPTNSSDNARKTDSSVSEHDKALVRKNNKFWVDLHQCHHQLRVLRLHQHLSPSLLRKFP
ncbi:hypothetical protein Rs2_34513 [Raphanus sativus]|nr:hypothetical protein Rs2_34513 [Raphanus sativus]